MPRLLILGGTGEARALARKSADLPGLEVVYSLAGRTKAPNLPPCTVRTGGFGGAEGLEAYLKDAAIDLVIDATHPFAAEMAANAARACARAGRPRLKLLRPAWRERPGDRWIHVADMAEAARALDGLARRVLLTTGAKDLGVFGRLEGVRFIVRTIEKPASVPLGDGELILARGPFTVEDETRLLADRRIEALVTKNSGGEAAAAKLAAARTLGLPVVMIDRPAAPAGETAETVEGALDWLHRRR